jgi:hypothetical protein
MMTAEQKSVTAALAHAAWVFALNRASDLLGSGQQAALEFAATCGPYTTIMEGLIEAAPTLSTMPDADMMTWTRWNVTADGWLAAKALAFLSEFLPKVRDDAKRHGLRSGHEPSQRLVAACDDYMRVFSENRS